MVFSTKNRERTLAADKREDVYKYIWGILKNRKSHLYRIGGTEDHVHILSSLHLTQGTQVRVTSLVANFLDFPTSFVYALSMVRPWRVEFESAVYHVMCRGVARARIFRDRQDYERFEECLSAAADKFDLSVYAYVLMPNHYHLFLRTRKANLSRSIQHMQSCYAMYHNRKHRRVGHLFQGRFKSILVEDESYFAVLSETTGSGRHYALNSSA
jgi:REP element-mobilizing transposase RayT